MFWLLFALLSVVSGCGARESGASLSQVVEKAAVVLSRILDAPTSDFPFGGFSRLKQVVEGEEGGLQLVVRLLRLMGVDDGKVNDFAFDGFLSLLRLMGRVLVEEGEERRGGRKKERDFPSLRFILRQPQVSDLLKDMQNPRLVDLILKESERNLPGENVDCIRLLICKTKPFVRGMQRSLGFFMRRENITTPGSEEPCQREEACTREEEEDALWEETESLEGRMYFFVPSLREVVEEGDKCDQLYPDCIY